MVLIEGAYVEDLQLLYIASWRSVLRLRIPGHGPYQQSEGYETEVYMASGKRSK